MLNLSPRPEALTLNPKPQTRNKQVHVSQGFVKSLEVEKEGRRRRGGGVEEDGSADDKDDGSAEDEDDEMRTKTWLDDEDKDVACERERHRLSKGDVDILWKSRGFSELKGFRVPLETFSVLVSCESALKQVRGFWAWACGA